MSTFTITLKTDNDAFADGNAPAEVARILNGLVGRLLGSATRDLNDVDGITLRDLNGHPVGKVEVEADKQPSLSLTKEVDRLTTLAEENDLSVDDIIELIDAADRSNGLDRTCEGLEGSADVRVLMAGLIGKGEEPDWIVFALRLG